MSNFTQSYRLFQILKSGSTVSKETIAEELGVVLVSVPVYIHQFKNQFKAEIVAVRAGHKVTGYQLTNAEDLNVPQYRRNSLLIPENQNKPKKSRQKKVVEQVATPVVNDGSVPVIDKDAEITQYNEREFGDIRESLGIGFGGGFE